MNGNLEGYRGIVTGAAGPLGLAISRALIADGARVVGVDRASAIAKVGNAPVPGLTLVVADLMDVGQIEHFCQQAITNDSRIDFLINNAAFTGDSNLAGYAVPFEAQTDDAFLDALKLNLLAPFTLVRRLCDPLRASGRGAVVNLAAIYGLVGPNLSLYTGTRMGNPAAYAASKGGLVQMTRYLATVLAPNIRVNAVAPGGIERGQDPQFVQRYEALTPMGRMGKESDVTGIIRFLIGPESSYLTGQCIAVDGGWTAW